MATVVERDVRPPSPFRMPRWGGEDRVMRVRDGVASRLLHVDGCPVLVRAWEPVRGVVRLRSEPVEPGSIGSAFAAAELPCRHAGRPELELAVERMRFALGVDDDLGPFYERFRDDPLIGRSVRTNPGLRATRRPEPFEALAWAICEQLIEFVRAAEIERRIVRFAGPRWDAPPLGPLRDVPSAAAVAALSPARLESFDLTPTRALALHRAAREVARGRIDLHDPDHERGWARLRRIRGIGAWTVEFLALHGQGRYDQLPAGDLMYRKWLGRARAGGNPAARAEEDEVRAFFARYGEWAALAGLHAVTAADPAKRGLLAA
jgi:3-methyladenine DNA glycosylase/8-oxoguanine DNA glycosylase